MARFVLHTLTPRPRLAVRTPAGERECLRFSKQLALLAYLAARPTGAGTREELVGLLWDDSELRDARRALRQAVYQIRQNTDHELLVGDALLSLAREDLDFDVTLFREHLSAGRLEQALALYQGDFLATVGLAGAREFEHWADGLRQQLAAERRQLLRTLMAQATDQGRWSDAARYARLLIEQDRLDLEPRLRLVELMALSGDLVGAQVEAEDVRRLAAETQGLRLPEAIETAIARALAAGQAPERRRPGGFPRHPEMVGRATEFRRVVERWKSALDGRGGCVLISGEPGSGKTRLVRELERRLRRDRSLVLASVCYPVEGTQPFAPFLEMIAQAHAVPGLSGTSPSSLEILAALLPEIAQQFRGAIQPRQLPIPTEAVAGALLDAFTAMAEEVPVALLVEDLHWTSPVTIAFAHQLARRADRAALLLLLTAHDVARSAETTRGLRDLAASDAVDAIALPPLDAADVAQLLSTIARMPDEPTGARLAERVVRHTAGVPLYVLELLKALYDGGRLAVKEGAWVIPNGLIDESAPLSFARSGPTLLRQRLEALDQGARTVLAALAVWGRGATVQEIAQIAELAEDAVRGGLDLLARRRLLGQPSERAYAVLHEQIGEVARAAVSPVLIATLGRNAATLAESRAHAGPLVEWFVATRHWAAAGDAARAALNAARGAAAIEVRSGEPAARDELRSWLGALSEELRPDIEPRLRDVLEGRTSARSWLEGSAG